MIEKKFEISFFGGNKTNTSPTDTELERFNLQLEQVKEWLAKTSLKYSKK